jgi:hypothetical protein
VAKPATAYDGEPASDIELLGGGLNVSHISFYLQLQAASDGELVVTIILQGHLTGKGRARAFVRGCHVRQYKHYGRLALVVCTIKQMEGA